MCPKAGAGHVHHVLRGRDLRQLVLERGDEGQVLLAPQLLTVERLDAVVEGDEREHGGCRQRAEPHQQQVAGGQGVLDGHDREGQREAGEGDGDRGAARQGDRGEDHEDEVGGGDDVAGTSRSTTRTATSASSAPERESRPGAQPRDGATTGEGGRRRSAAFAHVTTILR